MTTPFILLVVVACVALAAATASLTTAFRTLRRRADAQSALTPVAEVVIEVTYADGHHARRTVSEPDAEVVGALRELHIA